MTIESIVIESRGSGGQIAIYFHLYSEYIREEVVLTLRLISVCFEQRGSNCDLFLPAAVLWKQRLQCYELFIYFLFHNSYYFGAILDIRVGGAYTAIQLFVCLSISYFTRLINMAPYRTHRMVALTMLLNCQFVYLFQISQQ